MFRCPHWFVTAFGPRNLCRELCAHTLERVDYDVARTTISSGVSPKLDYCNTVQYGKSEVYCALNAGPTSDTALVMNLWLPVV